MWKERFAKVWGHQGLGPVIALPSPRGKLQKRQARWKPGPSIMHSKAA